MLLMALFFLEMAAFECQMISYAIPLEMQAVCPTPSALGAYHSPIPYLWGHLASGRGGYPQLVAYRDADTQRDGPWKLGQGGHRSHNPRTRAISPLTTLPFRLLDISTQPQLPSSHLLHLLHLANRDTSTSGIQHLTR